LEVLPCKKTEFDGNVLRISPNLVSQDENLLIWSYKPISWHSLRRCNGKMHLNHFSDLRFTIDFFHNRKTSRTDHFDRHPLLSKK